MAIFAAYGFAVVQPVLSVFGKSPDAFIFRRADSVDIVAFAFVVTLAIPVAFWIVEVLIALRLPRTARVVHLVGLAGFAGLWAIQVIGDASDVRGTFLLVAAILFGSAFVVGYVQLAAVRTFLGFLAITPAIFVALFLGASQTTDLFSAGTNVARAEGRAGTAPSVVLVIFDEWPTSSVMDSAGEISSAYPNLAKLAATSTWYRNASSVSNATPYAVPAILTGSLPHDGLPTAVNYPHNLFKAFGKKYRLEVSESVTSLCTGSACRTATSGAALPSLVGDATNTFGEMVSLDRTHRDPTTSFVETVKQLGKAIGQRSVRFEQFLAGFHRGSAPTVHVLHILLPHVPYRFLPSGVEYAAPPAEGARTSDLWDNNPLTAELAHQRLLLQNGFVDGLIGQLTDRLRATDQFDSSVVAITADHGIAFTPGGPSRGLSDVPLETSQLPELLDVPLIIKAPQQTQGAVSDANVMSIDVLPTLASLAGQRLPWRVDGFIAGQRSSNDKFFIRASAETGVVKLGPVRAYRADQALATLLAGPDVDSLTVGPDGPYRLFNPARLGGLVGRRIASLTQGAPASFRVTLADANALKSAARSAAKIPAMLVGFTNKDAVIAIALNGTVAGVAPTAPVGGSYLFVAMAPDTLIRDHNAVSLYEVSGLPANPILHRIR